MFFYQNYLLFFLFAIPGLLLGLYARSRVNSAFKKYSKVRTLRNLTGAQVARSLLDAEGLYDVVVEESDGFLSDHYDPRHRVLRLSKDVYHQPSVASAGVAAHEMGHAMQHAGGYIPLQFRSALVPAAKFGSNLAPLIFMAGLMLSLFISSEIGIAIAWVGVGIFAVAVMFTLITLPVEFNASRRAKVLLKSSGTLISNEEYEGVNKVLDAAALTYVAAAVAAIGQLLYYVFILTGRRR